MDYERARAEVNLDTLAHNVRQIKKVIPAGVKLMAVVKADAYGHGDVPVARRVLESGADWLAVAFCDEGLKLRQNGVTAPILVLGYTSLEDIQRSISQDLTLTVFSKARAESISQAASALGVTANIHIKVDTGMGRLGFFADEENLETISHIHSLPGLVFTGIYTHFASSGDDQEYTERQYEQFTRFVAALEDRGVHFPCRHASNSGGTLHHPILSLDMIRTGISLYGLWPSKNLRYEGVDLRPVLSLKSQICSLKKFKKGESIGYGRTYFTKEDALIGVVPVGYADGFSRHLSNRGSVLVRGWKAPIIGNICMDQFMINVTGIEGVSVGDEAVLIGRQGEAEITANTLAELQGTIGYEVLCNISKRVPRKYIYSSEGIE